MKKLILKASLLLLACAGLGGCPGLFDAPPASLMQVDLAEFVAQNFEKDIDAEDPLELDGIEFIDNPDSPIYDELLATYGDE